LPIIHISKEDELMWMYDKFGHYTVKSGYDAIQRWKVKDEPGPPSSDTSTVLGRNYGLSKLSLGIRCSYGESLTKPFRSELSCRREELTVPFYVPDVTPNQRL
jgi:hypothetical protein